MSTARQISLREKTKSALERIAAIEESFDGLLKGLEHTVQGLNTRLSTLEETLAAVVRNIGTEQVQATVLETRRERQEQQAIAAKKEITDLVTAGTLVAAEEVGEDSFIVGHDVDAKGETVFPGFGHVHFKAVKPELQAGLKGSKVGAKIGTVEGSEQGFVIDTIYTFVPPAPPEAAEKAAQ